MIAVLGLANVWTLPLALQTRGPLGGRLGQAIERLLRGRLPRAGLALAEHEVARLRAQHVQHGAVAAPSAEVTPPTPTPHN